MQLKPAYPDAFVARAATYTNMLDHKNAIADYSSAIKLNPRNAQTWLKRGLSKSYIKDYTGSISDLNEAIKINPALMDAYINRGLAKIATNQNGCADLKKAADAGNPDALRFMNQYCK